MLKFKPNISFLVQGITCVFLLLGNSSFSSLEAQEINNSIGDYSFVEDIITLSNGEWKQEIEYYQKSLNFYKEVDDREGQGKIYQQIAYIYSSLGFIDQEIAYYRYALAAYKQANNLVAVSYIYYQIGQTYIDVGQIDKAKEHYFQALWRYEAELKKHKNLYHTNYGYKKDSQYHAYVNLPKISISLGKAYLLNGQANEAIDYYSKAVDYYYSNNRWLSRETKEKIGLVYVNLGNIYLDIGQTKQALKYYQKANTLYEAKYGCCYYSKRKNYNNLGEAYKKLGKMHLAIAYHRKAFRKHYSASFRGLAAIYTQLGEHNKALRNYQTTAHIARRNMNLFEEAIALRNIGNLYQQIGNFEQAIANYEKSLILAFDIRHLLLESYPEKFFQENKDVLHELLFLLRKTQKQDQYHKWNKAKTYFDYDQYLKVKHTENVGTNLAEKQLIEQWYKRVYQLRDAYQQVNTAINPENLYFRQEYKMTRERYRKISREFNLLADKINKTHPELAKLLQVKPW